jgi:AcrR family transcriptional regulator
MRPTTSSGPTGSTGLARSSTSSTDGARASEGGRVGWFIPKKQNVVPSLDSPLAAQAVRRALAGREAAYVQEVQRLLDAGMAAMEAAEHGGAPRVADIVRAAGLSNQAFYRHFASRDELIAAVVERGGARLVSYAAHQMEKASDPAEAIRRWILAVLSQASNKSVAQQTRAVMWNLRQLPRSVDQVAPSAHAAAAALLVEPLGALGCADPDRDAAAIGDLVFGRLEHHLWGPDVTDADIDHVVAFCLAAVGAPR